MTARILCEKNSFSTILCWVSVVMVKICMETVHVIDRWMVNVASIGKLRIFSTQ
jgi:hypothetical protein